MKSSTRFILLLVALAALTVVPCLRAQLTPITTTVHSFTGSDGAHSLGGLILGNDGSFYGTTSEGGSDGVGTIFRMTQAGVITTNLHNFIYGGTDGAYPDSGFVQPADGNFYGTTYYGGSRGDGNIYRLTPAGAVTTLHSFTGSGTEGSNPTSLPVLGSDGNFYGSTRVGGSSGQGTLWRLTAAGVFTTLHDFTGSSTDGAQPDADLVLGNDGNLYGTTNLGGASDDGVIFRLTTAGVVTILHSFTGQGTDGAKPDSGLFQARDGNFYGVTTRGGSNNAGTLYQLTPAGVVTTLHNFTSSGPDGAQPKCVLIQAADGNFYGTAHLGGSKNHGTVFRMTPAGVVTNLHTFTRTGTDGAEPNSALAQDNDGNFYSTTYYGGSSDDGTVFEVSLKPVITSGVTAAGTQGTAFSYQIAATNEPAGYGAQGLPAGLTVNTNTGLISGTPTVAGKFTVILSADNGLSTGTATLTLTIAPTVPVITSAVSATATEGKAFSYQITATRNPTRFAASGLPPGLSINTATGVISGTPTQENGFPATVYATNANGTGSATLTIIVRGPLEITSAATAALTQGEAFSYQIIANENVTTYGARGLPTGLTIDTGNGAISGTPFNSGTAAVEISAGNATATAFARLTITITPSLPAFASPNTAPATQDQPFFYRLTATNAPTSFAARGLPTGLTLDETKGYITGRPINMGVAAVKVSATNAAGTTSMRLTFTIASGVPVVTSATTATATVGQAFSYQITATNTPTRYAAFGLPTGLEINPSTGLITGTPKDAGKAAVTLSATNKAGTGTAKLTLTITSS